MSTQQAAPTLFDFISDITYDKDYRFTDGDSKAYNAFMINRGVGQHIDCVMLANEMNKRPNLSQLMHHDFLFYAVDSKKRYGKWTKAEDQGDDLIEFVQKKYCVNRETAIDYMKLLDKKELKQLKLNSENKGGTNK